MLHPFYSVIQFLTLVLQQSSSFVPHEDLGQNAKKSCYLDFRSIQNLTYGKHWSNYQNNPHQIPPTKTRKKVSTSISFATAQSHYKIVHGWPIQFIQETHPPFHQLSYELTKKHCQRLFNWFKQQGLWYFPFFFTSSPGVCPRFSNNWQFFQLFFFQFS